MAATAQSNRWLAPRTYERLAAELQKKNAAALAALCADAEAPARALDAGCGTGFLAEAIARRTPAGSITCVDVSPEMLALARARPVLRDCTFLCMSLLDVAEEPGFDLIASNAALHWLYPRYAETFAKLRRLARPGARLGVAVAGRCAASDRFDDAVAQVCGALGAPLDPVPFTARRLRPAEIEACARTAGFVVDDAFLLERWLRMPVADYGDWLIASGGPWAATVPAPRAAFSDEVSRRLAGGQSTVDVGHWSTFLLAHG